LIFHSNSSLKQWSADRHVRPFRYIINYFIFVYIVLKSNLLFKLRHGRLWVISPVGSNQGL